MIWFPTIPVYFCIPTYRLYSETNFLNVIKCYLNVCEIDKPFFSPALESSLSDLLSLLNSYPAEERTVDTLSYKHRTKVTCYHHKISSVFYFTVFLTLDFLVLYISASRYRVRPSIYSLPAAYSDLQDALSSQF